jgi:hypothetical protein
LLPAILAQIGLPILTRVVSSGLSAIDDPAAKAASKALGEIGDALDGGRVQPEQLAAANRHVEAMTRLSVERETGVLAQINETMRTEARSEDAYVRRWRPTFGYAVAVTWTVQMAGLTYAVVMTPKHAGEILAAMTHLSVIWSVALSVLGINVAKRSQDKAVAVGRKPAPSLVERLTAPLLGDAETAGGARAANASSPVASQPPGPPGGR